MIDNKAYLVRPVEAGPYVLAGPVGELGANARFAIFQDGITVAHQMLPSQAVYGTNVDGAWLVRNDIDSGEALALWENGRTVYQLSLETGNGGVYQCGEVDLWILAVGDLPDVAVPQPGIIHFNQQVPIGGLDHLWFTWQQGITSAHVTARCGTGQDIAVTMGSVYFRNFVTGQTFQYQLYTFDTRNFHPSGTYYSVLQNGEFFVAADDLPSQYGRPYTTPGGAWTAVQVDILPRVLDRLQNAPNANVDKNPDNWKVVMTTIGPFVNGDGHIDSRWSDLDLVGVPKQSVPVPPQPQPQPQPQPSPQPVDCPPFPQPQPTPQPQPSPSPTPQPIPIPVPQPPGPDPRLQTQIDEVRQDEHIDRELIETVILPRLTDDERRITTLEEMVPTLEAGPPGPPGPAGPPGPPGPPNTLEIPPVDQPWPGDRIPEITTEITTIKQRLDECCKPIVEKAKKLVLHACNFGKRAWGRMAECWLDDNTPAPPVPVLLPTKLQSLQEVSLSVDDWFRDSQANFYQPALEAGTAIIDYGLGLRTDLPVWPPLPSEIDADYVFVDPSTDDTIELPVTDA